MLSKYKNITIRVCALNKQESTPGMILAWKWIRMNIDNKKFVLLTEDLILFNALQLQLECLGFCCWISYDELLQPLRPPHQAHRHLSAHPRTCGRFRLWFQQTQSKSPFHIAHTALGARLRAFSYELADYRPKRISCRTIHSGVVYHLH